jgi:hypothetical protein
MQEARVAAVMRDLGLNVERLNLSIAPPDRKSS